MSDNLARAEARERAELLSDVSYEVELDLVDPGDEYASTTVVHFSCAQPGASTFVDLKAAAVHDIRLNGRDVDASSFTGDRILLRGLDTANELEVRARCRYERTGLGLHKFTDPVDGNIYLHTQFEPFDAHRVYACFDQPDLKAPFRLTVHAPADWCVVSNNAVVSEPDNRGQDARTWRFGQTLPLSTYITALVAGPYHVVRDRHGDINLGVYCRQSLAEYLDTDEIFEVTRQGFDYFTQRFGYEYPFGGEVHAVGDGSINPNDVHHKKYDQLFVPEFNWGAMENAGCVTFSESYVFRSKVTEAARQSRASTILHEMAHMWFGDLVTMRWWDDLWLNESFATYMATRALAEATRFTNAWTGFADDIKAWAVAQDQLPSTHPIVADIVDTEAVRTNFDGITYAKGASVLKQLVAWVGDEAFFSGLRDYFAGHAFSNAELGDFLAALEKGSGRALSEWSAQWLETAGVATLRPAYTLDADGTYGSFAITQEAVDAHPTLRAHRLAVGLYDATGDGLVRRQRLELDITGARTDVPHLVGERQPDLLLLNDDDLTFGKLRLDERSIDTLMNSLSKLDESLARALCWGAAWDMTRDAELPARRFVQLVADHAAGESQIDVLQSLLRQADAAIDRYGDPGNRTQARALIASRARGELSRAEPGSDLQLVWARCLITNAEAPEDLQLARGLLDGSVTVDGLAVDHDLRWHIVGSLASKGEVGEDLIAAEEQRDATDMGARRAASARAARPLADAKERAWTAVLDDPELTLAMRRAMMGGFHQFGQEELLRAFADRYVEAIGAIWAPDRHPEESLQLTSGLYPSTIIEQATLDAADRALTREDLPAPGRRLVLEARDATQRALRARAVDKG